MIHKIFHQNPVLSSRDFIPIFSCSDGSDVALYQERSKNDVWPCQSRYTKDICALPEQYDQSVFCFNVEVDCKGEMFICDDRTQCIYKTSFCDGYRDCRDGSDEKGFDDDSIYSGKDGAPCRSWKYLFTTCLLPGWQRKELICNIGRTYSLISQSRS